MVASGGLRAVFDISIEGHMLMRSLSRAPDEVGVGRCVTTPVPGPLFTDRAAESDDSTGTISLPHGNPDPSLVAANSSSECFSKCP